MRRDPVEDPLGRTGIREQAVHLRGPQPGVRGGGGGGLRLQVPGRASLQPPEGRVAGAGDDGPAAHADPAGMRRLAMISRITSLVPAPIPQFCRPREQRAT